MRALLLSLLLAVPVLADVAAWSPCSFPSATNLLWVADTFPTAVLQ